MQQASSEKQQLWIVAASYSQRVTFGPAVFPKFSLGSQTPQRQFSFTNLRLQKPRRQGRVEFILHEPTLPFDNR